MRRSPATSDRGIRSIFASAMGLEPKPLTFSERMRAKFDRRAVRHAMVGGSVGLTAAIGGFVTLSASVSAETPHAPIEREAPTRSAKADRLDSHGGKLAAMSRELGLDGRSAGTLPIASTVTAYAADAPRGGALAAIETNIEPSRLRVASLGTPEVPAVSVRGSVAEDDEDEDDVAIIPVPQARPERPLADLPLPRPRPRVTAALTTGADGGANEDADEERAAPSPPPASAAPQAAPGQILGFFSSPTEPVRAPSTKKIDTPFGVPYVLQTGSVETACLKPELVEILRRIEGKYHQKVVITSGFRDRGRQGSLHRTCAAVDIEVPGVPAEALAAFARTIPGIGGVGTYCYPHLIHVDIGAPRDWKYGCGSFFAMRGAPGKWGKVPSALASAQPAGDAKIDPATLAD